MAKCKYYADQFEKNKSNIRHTWSTTKEILSKKRNKKDFPNYFKLSDQHISDPMAMANHFNIFFANIGPELSKNHHSNSEKSVSSYMKQTIISSFNFECVNSEIVEKIILELSSKNSCGSDGLSTNFLKRISKIIAAPLSVIINQSLVTGIFPDRLKIAKVIPLFKKGDDHVFDNDRPISLLSSISKVVEKIVFIQVYDYFSKQNLLYDGQYGFRKIHSTELAAVELVDRIRLYLDKGQIPLSVFLDLSKAFDTLDHSILLTKLNFYGFSGSALMWFQSYLSHRQQCVDFDGTVSDICTLSTGVPQGSILGPLLFIIYMNDIHIANEQFNFILYADDTNMISPMCSFSSQIALQSMSMTQLSHNINVELNNIQEWLSINKLSLNVKKTKFMIFHYRQRNIDNLILDLQISSENNRACRRIQFPGINCGWKSQLERSYSKGI